MLQDIEARRAPEIEALVGAVIEMAGLAAVATPRLATVYALVKLMTEPGGQS